MASTFRKNLSLNYIYFGFYLAILLMLNIHHVLLVATDAMFPRLYFALYAFGETVVEVAALALLSQLIKRYFKRWIYKTFIALATLFIVVHIVDFVLVRIMGMSIWFALGMVFDGTMENFIEMIHIVEFDLSVCLLAILALIMIPLSGIILYNLTHKVSKRRPFIVKHSLLFRLICVVPIALIALDVTIAHYVTGEHFLRFANALPFKSTFVSKKMDLVHLKEPLGAPPSEENALAILNEIPIPEVKRPNLFLFVTESLRSDFINGKTAPVLSKFAQENISIPNSYSNANATQLSWYAITHGKYAYNWSHVQRNGWKSGGMPLQAFKKLGYKVRVYSGSQLKYYNLDTLMFGKERHLLDTFAHFPQYGGSEIWEGDQKAVDNLLGDLDKEEMKEGNLCLIFFDSTHFNYSWPDIQEEVFQPLVDKVNYMSLSRSMSQVEGLKNRYRSSIRYVDTLFEKIQKKIVSMPGGNEMAVVFTGDHGEEFYEQGQLYHASHLSEMQTEVPIYYSLGNQKIAAHQTTSHIDIMPTLLHYVAKDERFGKLCDGKSLLSSKGKGYEVCARYNGGRTPYEFFVTDGKEKMVLRFTDRNIFRGKTLQVLTASKNRKALKPPPERFTRNRGGCMQTFIDKVKEKESLTENEACEVFVTMAEALNEKEAKEFLSELHKKGETAEELCGFISGIKRYQAPCNVEGSFIDIVGVGKKGLRTINISTATAILTAACGAKVAKHGNKSAGKRCRSGDVLEMLGLDVNFASQFAENTLEEFSICYLYIPFYFPVVRRFDGVRSKIAHRTIFDLVDPFLNPTDPDFLVLGVADEELVELYGEVVWRQNRKKSVIVHGGDVQELSPIGKAKVMEVVGHEKRQYTLDPQDFGIQSSDLKPFKGGNARISAHQILRAFEGHEFPVFDALTLHAGLALHTAGHVDSIESGIARAKEVLHQGDAFDLLNNWVDYIQKRHK